ncbi:MAG TPA: extracellular solute-binding protein [Candidatus Sulfomarinibacteraceae bacterium]|nr:extracellular solute-binding protein [Candidatus Sulfomarinibacteraceae bacterium]
MTTTRTMPRLMVGGAILAIIVAACGGGASEAPATTAPTAAPATEAPATEAPDPMAALIEAAKAEGTLTTIALPHDWCAYGAVIDGFKAKYGLEVNELDPNAGSGDEIEAIKANKDNPGPQAPDVIDVGLAFGPSAKAEGLIQPYKVATWDTIPDSAKDAEGYWYGDYYGVLSFEVNTAVVTNVPKDWADLLKPEYASQIALAGDPLASNQAIQTVFAASLANGGSLDDASKGLDFFKQLNDAGNFVPVIAKPGTIASGETPITIRWTYNALSNRDGSAASGGPAIEVVVPTSGRFAGVYVQAISAYAPHPNAAKLWMEYLYSDEGQNLWLSGYCHPIRYENLVATNAVPAEALAKLPDVAGAVFPSLDQLNAAKALITTEWPNVVGAVVQ